MFKIWFNCSVFFPTVSLQIHGTDFQARIEAQLGLRAGVALKPKASMNVSERTMMNCIKLLNSICILIACNTFQFYLSITPLFQFLQKFGINVIEHGIGRFVSKKHSVLKFESPK